MSDLNRPTHRRSFLSSLAAGATALGLGALVPRGVVAQPTSGARRTGDSDLDAWLDKITGKHKQVYDMPEANGGIGLAWSRVFYMTNEETGVPASDVTVAVVLRHGAIPLAMPDAMWAKYKLGEELNITDPETGAPSVRNPFYREPKTGSPLPGMAIESLMASGTLFGVCHMAIKVVSGSIAGKMNTTAEEVAADMVANLIPGVQLLPSGVWAVNRTQERGCTYCFAG